MMIRLLSQAGEDPLVIFNEAWKEYIQEATDAETALARKNHFRVQIKKLQKLL